MLIARLVRVWPERTAALAYRAQRRHEPGSTDGLYFRAEQIDRRETGDQRADAAEGANVSAIEREPAAASKIAITSSAAPKRSSG
jgi:hypothetical protein